MAIPDEAVPWDDKGFSAALDRLRTSRTINADGRRITRDQFERLREVATEADGMTWGQLERVSFRSTVFEGDASFENAIFGKADFHSATFIGDARFHSAVFEEWSHFNRATFEADAWFVQVAFEGDASFRSATFRGEIATFLGSTFDGVVGLNETRFERARNLGAIRGSPRLLLDSATFLEHVTVGITAGRVVCKRTEFHRGANLRVASGDVVLDEARFGAPSVIDGSAGVDKGAQTASDPETQSGDATPPPRVVSLRRADVAHLALSSMDLSTCLFAGAHNLDLLHVEGPASFPSPPPGWRRTHSWMMLRWSPRDTIAEEQHWRARQESWADGWQCLDQPGEYPLDEPGFAKPRRLEATEIAEIYRALRKGREDRKNEPGAADFYYGEMEMRRHAARQGEPEANTRAASVAERAVLWLYWLVCGYGLRAGRAIAALSVTVLVFAGLLYATGLKEPHVDLGTALLQSFEGATLRSGDRSVLSSWGKAEQALLRLLGPLFFGLAIFSLRGRIKR